MYKHRLFMLMVLGLWLGQVAVAQDPQAERVLRESKQKLESLQDFAANFSYVIDNPQMPRKVEPRTGKIRYKGGKYALLMPDQEIYCDLETLWIYLPEDKEVTIMPYDPEEGFTLESIFSIYEAHAKARYEGTESVHGITCDKIYLAIQDDDLDYNQAYVWVNPRTLLLEKVALIDRRQTTTTYEFVGLRANLGFAEGQFRFDPARHPGVTVLDER
ncbi:MAG: outer membrane lipoprotein carrier protein LolA [Bacteroidetes bacterium]|nr:MAG: outer membrane lipoprotein carrier protein LolA [Bacteroidota bacterium]